MYLRKLVLQALQAPSIFPPSAVKYDMNIAASQDRWYSATRLCEEGE
jgi:hypothetical protein